MCLAPRTLHRAHCRVRLARCAWHVHRPALFSSTSRVPSDYSLMAAHCSTAPLRTAHYCSPLTARRSLLTGGGGELGPRAASLGVRDGTGPSLALAVGASLRAFGDDPWPSWPVIARSSPQQPAAARAPPSHRSRGPAWLRPRPLTQGLLRATLWARGGRPVSPRSMVAVAVEGLRHGLRSYPLLTTRWPPPNATRYIYMYIRIYTHIYLSLIHI